MSVMPALTDIERRAARLADLIAPMIAAEIAIMPPPKPDGKEEALMRACKALGFALDRFDQAKHTKNEGYARNQVIQAARSLKRIMEGRHDGR